MPPSRRSRSNSMTRTALQRYFRTGLNRSSIRSLRALFLCLCLMHFAVMGMAQDPPCFENSIRSKISVVVVLAADCPISQKYIPSLNALRKRFTEQDLHIQAIFPGHVKKSARKKFTREYNLTFPLETDKNFLCVNRLGATVSPEVFVFDTERIIRYRGAIDNWFYELGGYRKAATENYLADAITSLLAGKLPAMDSTTALGCYIQLPDVKR